MTYDSRGGRKDTKLHILIGDGYTPIEDWEEKQIYVSANTIFSSMDENTTIHLQVIGDKLHLILVKLLKEPAQSIAIKIVGMQETFTTIWYDNLVVLIDNEVIASVVGYCCFNGLNGEFFKSFHLPSSLDIHDTHDDNDQDDRDTYPDLNVFITNKIHTSPKQ